MPTPVYKSQITLHAYFPLAANLANPPTSGLDQPVWEVGLAASDAANSWYLSVEMLYDFANTQWTVRATYYHTLTPLPYSFPGGIGGNDNVAPFPFAGTQDYDGNPTPGPMIFPQDWVISITKDYDNDRIRFEFPWTPFLHDYALSNPLFVKDSSALRPTAIYSRDHGGNHNADPSGFTCDFRNISGAKNGSPFVQAAMSAADPGLWEPTTHYEIAFPPIPNLDAQLVTDYRMGYSDPQPSPPPWATGRQRNFVNGSPAGIDEIDACLAPVSGDLAVVGVLSDAPHALKFWYSSDDAVTLNPVTVAVDPTLTYRFPSLLAWPDGRLVVFYVTEEVTDQIPYATSGNGGRTWATGGFLTVVDPPIAAPRFRLDPTGSLLYLAYIGVNTLDLRLQRFGSIFSGDGNPLEATPLIVATGVGTYEQPDLFWDEAGRVFITYLAATTPRMLKSSDMGVTWSLATNFLTALHRRQFSTGEIGLSAHTHQEQVTSPCPLHVRISEDAGISQFQDVIIASPAEPEYCPIVAGGRAQLWVVTAQPVTGTRQPRVYRSDDIGKTWASVTTSP